MFVTATQPGGRRPHPHRCPTAEDFDKSMPVADGKFSGIMPASAGILTFPIRDEVRSGSNWK
jgi:hypothetical protein